MADHLFSLKDLHNLQQQYQNDDLGHAAVTGFLNLVSGEVDKRKNKRKRAAEELERHIKRWVRTHSDIHFDEHEEVIENFLEYCKE